MPGVYTTGISGVGMRLRNGSGTPIVRGAGQDCHSVISQLGAGGSYSFSGSLELVRISGTIASDSVLSASQFTWLFGVYQTGFLLHTNNRYNSRIYPTGTIGLKSIACTPSFPAVVTLPKVNTSELRSVGATAGMAGFNIGLRCDEGAKLGITLNAAPGLTVLNAPSGILGTQPGGAAGVGVQILDRSLNPVPMSSQFNLGTINENVQHTFPFSARYIRVGALTPGTVTSAMTFTFDYQ